MKCKWHKCSNEARAKSPYCSGTCKKRYSRASGTEVPVEVGQTLSGTQVGQCQNKTSDVAPGSTNSDGGEQNCPDKVLLQKVVGGSTWPNYTEVEGKTYGRQSVKYEADQFETRPQPLSDDDCPVRLNRGKYTRSDGSVYQFDCRGHSFNLTNGKVYQTIDDVRACYAEAQA